MKTAAVLALVAVLAGCSSPDTSESRESAPPASRETDPEPRTPPEPPPAAAAGGNAAGDPGPGEQPLLGLPEVVAEMDGHKVTREELLRRLLEWYGPDALEEIILKHVFESAVKDSGASVLPAELKERIDKEFLTREKEAQAKYKMTLKQFLAELGTTVEAEREKLEKSENLQREILLKYMLGYAYLTEPRIALSHIVVGSVEKAEDLRRKAREGADFAKLAQTESDDAGSSKAGGKLPEFIRGMSRLGDEFEEEAFSLQKPGDISHVVKTKMGYHVMRLNTRQEANPQTFEKLRDQVRTIQMDPAALSLFMQRLRKQYVKDLKYFVPDLEPKKK